MTAIGAVRRSDQVYHELVSRRETLHCGYAYTNEHFPELGECNFVGEVVLKPGGDPVAEVQRYFADAGLRCWRWVPAEIQPPDQLGPMLEPHGYVRHEHQAFVQMTAPELIRRTDLRVLSARAMRNAYTLVVTARSASIGAAVEQLTAAQLERLNEPQYDAFVALVDDRPAGMISLLQVGEIGRVCDLFVDVAMRGSGIGGGLLQYALQTAHRWALRPVCARIPAGNAAAQRLFLKCGFAPGGNIVSYVLPDAVEAGA